MRQNANVTLTFNNPTGSIVTTTIRDGVTTATMKWTPTGAQAASYVLTIGCYDSTGMQCTGQSSFSITVSKFPSSLLSFLLIPYICLFQ